MNRVVIVVPTYKDVLNESEKISLKQLKKILGGYDIYFICPKHLNAEYLLGYKIKRFDDLYFAGIEGYNRLMLSEDFYIQFRGYEYILVYQLDAFVFEDKLIEFCDYDYDYIGAPWLTGPRTTTDEGYRYVNVGNGGFSLRKISACIQVIRKHKEEIMTFDQYEDVFFALQNGNGFSVAPIDIALKFSFEREVRECYRLNHNQLPFGCHAWEKYDYDFWKPILVNMGYDVANIVSKGNLDMEISAENKELKKEEAFWGDRGKLCIDKIENRKIFIWGAGKYGKRMLKILDNYQIKVMGFIDNNLQLCGKTLNGVNIYKFQVVEDSGDCLIIIAIWGKNGRDVKKQLEDMGKEYGKDFIYYYDAMCL